MNVWSGEVISPLLEILEAEVGWSLIYDSHLVGKKGLRLM